MGKKRLLLILFLILLSFQTACAADENASGSGGGMAKGAGSGETEEKEDKDETTMIYAKIGDSVLEILPEENSSAEAFIALLQAGDLTVAMHDYGNFEKVGPLGTSLPTNDQRITTKPGDLILYQGNQITIYYDKNTWSFTRLGQVQGLTQTELKEILGTGNVDVTFSLKSE